MGKVKALFKRILKKKGVKPEGVDEPVEEGEEENKEE